MSMFKEARINTYTTIATTFCTTPLASLMTLLQPLTITVAPRYCCSKLTRAIANNVVISSIPRGVSVCECGVGDKAVVGEENF